MKQQALRMQLEQEQMKQRLQEQLHQQTMKGLVMQGAVAPGLLPTPASAAPMAAPIPAPVAPPAVPPAASSGDAVLMAQIQELQAQLERDKAALANIDDAPTPTSAAAVPTNSEGKFLENFQQLIQTAKGILNKDPRQSTAETEAAAIEETKQTSPKFDQALLDKFDHYDEDEETDEQRIAAQRRRLEEEQNKLENRPSDFQKFKEHRQQQQGPPFTDPSLPVPSEAQIEKTGNKSQDEDDMQIDNDEDLPEHFTRELGDQPTPSKRKPKWPEEQPGNRRDRYDPDEKRRRQSEEEQPGNRRDRYDPDEKRR